MTTVGKGVVTELYEYVHRKIVERMYFLIMTHKSRMKKDVLRQIKMTTAFSSSKKKEGYLIDPCLNLYTVRRKSLKPVE